MDPYKTLNSEMGDSMNTIRKNYYKKAMKMHPDKISKIDDSGMKQINDAYSLIGKNQKIRRNYDANTQQEISKSIDIIHGYSKDHDKKICCRCETLNSDNESLGEMFECITCGAVNYV
ncbi:hypothetical protein A3Q56_00557 [Intoshia linei]|uniref:J domain-containing protein n=1 Tax=Intoshia linei TaxID=1819745 RepID=A0A177BBU2_9BILA|nr:hypothetical protein A3Q56_00557 [Intoshia linei]